ncbi:MAG TPA: tetratricopeptide repeat protein [Gammaproteobacteria bacterium]|nr:tetratricopeptide repeat protein [Gammaproteobacteria bacterium]
MYKIISGITLLLASAICMAQGDIWNNLFQEKLREANQGNSEAQYDVGTMYQNGRGVKASRASAVEWFSKSAAQNNSQAASRLKLMSENETRFDRTLTEAEQGDRVSQYELGNMYTKGIGVDIDYRKAIAAYEKSAGQGYDKAAYKLGLIYNEGSGIPADMKAAFKWFRIAATNGYPAAQYYLGKMYAAGQGTGKDNALALEWLSKAVEGGFDQARGAMINVSENIAMEAAAARSAGSTRAEPEPAPVVTARKPAKPVVSRASKIEKPASKTWSLENLMLAAWYRDTDPVTYLPSAVNNCRIEDDRLVCLSDDQTRRTAANLIKYKTKAIIENFTDKGTFEVTYRNLVIDASRIESAESADETGDSNDENAYTVKTGWGTPHNLECQFKDHGTLTCVKNKSHSFELISPQNLAAGK